MSIVLAYEANDIIEAHIICGMLQANGLQAWVDGHYLQGAVGELSTMGFARVMVHDTELPQAKALLQEYAPTEVADATASDRPDPDSEGLAPA